MSGFIYLCSPYSSPFPAVREARYLAARKAAAKLNAEGRPCFSPIAHSHPMLEDEPGLGVAFEAWRVLDEAMIAACSEVVVLKLPGWDESEGITSELRMAYEIDVPVWFMEPVS